MPTTTPNPAELAEEIKRLERELCDIERRHCIGKAGALDIVGIRSDLHAAIDQLRDLASGTSAGAPVAWEYRMMMFKEAVPDGWSNWVAVTGLGLTRVRRLAERGDGMHELRALYAAPAATPPAEKEHRRGCDALGGYGHGVGPCSCGATPAEKEVRVPISEDDLHKAYSAWYQTCDCMQFVQTIFYSAFRFAEKHHGIQGEEA